MGSAGRAVAAALGGAALGGAALGVGVWHAIAGARPELDARRWTARGAPAGVESVALAGPLRPDFSALDLWGNRAASPTGVTLDDGASVTLEARVPDGATLGLRFGGGALAGPTAPSRGAGRGPDAPRTGVLVDRSARAEIRGIGLACAGPDGRPIPAPAADTFTLRAERAGGRLRLSVDGAPVGACTGPLDGALVLDAGLRRLQVRSLRVEGGRSPFADDFGGAWRGGPGALAAALLGALAGLAFARRRPALSVPVALSLLAVPLWALAPLALVREQLRLGPLPEWLAPLVLGGLPALALATLRAGAAAPGPAAALLRGLPALALALGAGALSRAAPATYAGLALLGATGPALALAGHCARSTARLAGPGLLLSAAAVLLLAEAGLRATPQGAAWTPTAGYTRATTEFAELVEIQQHRSYPSDGFPVRPPPPDPTRRRIVALGGSSTGGAFQMDDLALFWPRWLGDALAPQGVEVVNQGVGGWNSFHVRVYVESQIDRLSPEILVLYLGHNDIYTRTPAPYRDLFAAWQTGRAGPPPAAARLGAALATLRLYVGLRHVLIALRDRQSTVAVPVAHARDNFTALADLMAARGGRVLLVSEGVQPDATPLADYRAMMAALAADAPHVAYLDAAGRFDAQGLSDDFLDANHLSVGGHRRLAGWVAEALAAEGWVQPVAP